MDNHSLLGGSVYRLLSLALVVSAVASAATLIPVTSFVAPTIVTFPGNETITNPAVYTESGASFRGTFASQTVYLQDDMFNPNTQRGSVSFDVIFPFAVNRFGFLGNPAAVGSPSSFDVTEVIFYSDAAMTNAVETYNTLFSIASNDFFGLEGASAFAAVRITLNDTGQGFSPVLDDFRFEASAVPEPASLGLLAAGAGVLVLAWRRRASGTR
jgi:hypothetical protein